FRHRRVRQDRIRAPVYQRAGLGREQLRFPVGKYAVLGRRVVDEVVVAQRGCSATHDELPPFRASTALTVLRNAFGKTPLPAVPSTSPSTRPWRFLPSRT